MGIKNLVAKAGSKAADKVAKLSALSPEQLAQIQKQREDYLSEMPSADDSAAEEMTARYLAAASIEIYNAYLPQISRLYTPVENSVEYEGKNFNPGYNIRYFNITKWVI